MARLIWEIEGVNGESASSAEPGDNSPCCGGAEAGRRAGSGNRSRRRVASRASWTIPESPAFVEVPLRLLPAPLVSEDAQRIPPVLGALPLVLPPFPPVGRREG